MRAGSLAHNFRAMMPLMHENDVLIEIHTAPPGQCATPEPETHTKASVNAHSPWFAELALRIKAQAQALGFADAGITPAPVSAQTRERLAHWLAHGRHGEMDYMVKHAGLRGDPRALLPGTLTVISLRLPYWPQRPALVEDDQPGASGRGNAGKSEGKNSGMDGNANGSQRNSLWSDPRGERENMPGDVPENGRYGPDNQVARTACISRYARGRDYHKVVRARLRELADFIAAALRAEAPEIPFIYRVFSDSAPVLETEFAQRAGVGWRGKHTLTLTRTGSWHFLGEIYTNLPLPPDPPATNHCGDCQRCLDACPTGAIIAPYELDARRCISYLTIELPGAIPLELRPLIGNRIYGCDDCQTVCPWNRFAQQGDPAFAARAGLSDAALDELFAWTRETFETRLAGSPIRRIGYERWLRNIAVAIGNAPPDPILRAALRSRQNDPSPLVREHIGWALMRQQGGGIKENDAENDARTHTEQT